jgi:hypothetical protein
VGRLHSDVGSAHGGSRSVHLTLTFDDAVRGTQQSLRIRDSESEKLDRATPNEEILHLGESRSEQHDAFMLVLELFGIPVEYGLS